jgi:hypothetical protein
MAGNRFAKLWQNISTRWQADCAQQPFASSKRRLFSCLRREWPDELVSCTTWFGRPLAAPPSVVGSFNDFKYAIVFELLTLRSSEKPGCTGTA